jgi:hypothetical protein
VSLAEIDTEPENGFMPRDPHQSLATTVVNQSQFAQGQAILARLQWGKDDVAYSLHINPNSFGTYGIQATDFLNYLGFQRGECALSPGGQCFVRWADSTFDVPAFGAAFSDAYGLLQNAEQDLEACGFFLRQPEGWGHFFGRPSRGSPRGPAEMSGDGHTAAKRQQMKQSEDDVFLYRFTWLEGGRDQGWVIHYRPKHLPLSAEFESTFKFLGLRNFSDCPEFDFEPCRWRSIAYVSRGDGPFDSNVDVAHRWFDAHATRFAPGLQKFLSANSRMEGAGFTFLPFEKPIVRLNADVAQLTEHPSEPKQNDPEHFDVAISFAGSERLYAEELANILTAAGFSVFYDDFYPEFLWGKNLVDTFDEIYRKRARFCVMFISKEYRDRAWTNHERRSAQARALVEKGNEYILPIRIDDTDIPGLPPTIGYVPISKGIPEIGRALVGKLRS